MPESMFRPNSPEVSRVHNLHEIAGVDVPTAEQEVIAMEEQLREGRLPRKERLHLERKIAHIRSRLERERLGNVGRRIPEEIRDAVFERDRGRNFGRPDHTCERPGPPHHIRHFETFVGGHTRENPHTVENLEAPCADCHELAHALQVESGVSIEGLFRMISSEQWVTIEHAWKEGKTWVLKEIAQKLEQE